MQAGLRKSELTPQRRPPEVDKLGLDSNAATSATAAARGGGGAGVGSNGSDGADLSEEAAAEDVPGLARAWTSTPDDR